MKHAFEQNSAKIAVPFLLPATSLKFSKLILASAALLFGISSFFACSKPSGNAPEPPPIPPSPVDTTQNPPAQNYSYAYDSSFRFTGTFATMGALQPDGKIIIANKTQIARLNSDGTVDNSFALGSTTNGEFHCLALQKDGRLLLGGSFTTYNGQNKAFYLRLNANGSVDNSFTTLPLTFVSSQPNIDIRSIALQSDGKILLGGNFYHIVSEVNGVHSGQRQIIRLAANGAYDPSFQHNISADFVNCMRVLPDGKTLVTGQKLAAWILATDNTPEQVHNYVAKLNANGSVDPSFKWRTTQFAMRGSYAYLPAYGQDIALLEGGKLLLSGRFQTTSNTLSEDYNALVRLNADGSIDNTLPKRGFDGIVSSICLAMDRIVLGRMHDPERTYQNANIAIHQMNKNGTDDATYTVRDFTGYGDTYMILEDGNKNLILVGRFIDRLAVANYTYHGVIRLKKI